MKDDHHPHRCQVVVCWTGTTPVKRPLMGRNGRRCMGKGFGDGCWRNGGGALAVWVRGMLRVWVFKKGGLARWEQRGVWGGGGVRDINPNYPSECCFRRLSERLTLSSGAFLYRLLFERAREVISLSYSHRQCGLITTINIFIHCDVHSLSF